MSGSGGTNQVGLFHGGAPPLQSRKVFDVRVTSTKIKVRFVRKDGSPARHGKWLVLLEQVKLTPEVLELYAERVVFDFKLADPRRRRWQRGHLVGGECKSSLQLRYCLLKLCVVSIHGIST